jgi:hypothetical protein
VVVIVVVVTAVVSAGTVAEAGVVSGVVVASTDGPEQASSVTSNANI